MSQADFLARASAVHGDRYGYAATVYADSLSKVAILCPVHGQFWQRPSNHLLGRGCPRCKADATRDRCVDTLESFLAKARQIHGDAYDYSRVAYTRSNAKVEILCRVHGPFWQPPNAHVSGRSGCPKCAGKGRTTAAFVEEARQVHGATFGYDRAEYAGIKAPITVTCPVHGDFEQAAEGHLSGRGCRQCWQEATTSQGEDELAEWVSSLGARVERQDRAILGGKEIDIWLPDHAVGLEYHGYYWHSHVVQKDPRQHEIKQRSAAAAGVRLITVWEFDWAQRRAIVEDHIRHAIGLNQAPIIGARTCRLREIGGAEAAAFYERSHLQGACRGAVANLALERDGSVVAVMSFTKGGTRRGMVKDGEFELARYATSARVPGGACRLFAAFLRQHNPVVVWSFSDDQHFGGRLYHQLGFVADGAIHADYRVVDSRSGRVWHKSLWQRKSIPARLRELGIADLFDPGADPRTEAQMHDVARVWRIYDAGKTRWVWRA